MKKFLFTIIALCIAISTFAGKIVPADQVGLPITKTNYTSQDILLLYKSCYETIYFLGNTKYKGIRKPLIPEKVAGHCFCVCDAIRTNFPISSEFLKMDPGTLNRVVSPLSNECIKKLGPFWKEETSGIPRDYVQPGLKRNLWRIAIPV
jgi:hypothetical protein